MPLLIDTFNVLHTVGVLPPDLANTEVDGLVRLLQASRYRDEKITLACDGRPKPGTNEKPVWHVGTITVRYSGAGKPADDLIDQLIRASTAPRRLTVVSSDHAVIRSARRRRCRSMTSQEFLAELAADANIPLAAPAQHAKPPSAMSDQQIDRWVKVFDIDAGTLAIEARGKKRHPAPTASEASSDDMAPSQSSAPPSAKPVHIIKNLGRGEGLPDDLIEQAEQMWEREKKSPPAQE